ncbi:MAG: hypothetical protein KDE14_03000 [Rhodobacteraceae bacterium]|nr:hypothetical protein [Paracoccaceae bacterium]
MTGTAELHLAPRRTFAPPGTPPSAWLITFADLVLLLLTFFVLVFVMSRPVLPRYVPMAQSYLEVFNPIAVDEPRGKPMSFTVAQEATGDNLAYLRSVLETSFATFPTLQDVQFRSTARYLILSLENRAFFDAGRATLTPGAEQVIFDLAGVLGNLANPVAVLGSGDGSARDQAHWALGLSRADEVAQAMIRAGYTGTPVVLTRAEATGELEFVILAEGTRN